MARLKSDALALGPWDNDTFSPNGWFCRPRFIIIENGRDAEAMGSEYKGLVP